MSETTTDAFLGGKLSVCQPRAGYRAGVDPVLLAASVPARPGEHVLELGLGSGVALMCLMARVPGLQAYGVERDTATADLARRNFEANGMDASIFHADLAQLPGDLRSRSFDHVIANPPFFDRRRGSPAADAGREGGRGDGLALETWVDTAIRRLAPGGRVSMIQRAERLPELLAHLDARVGDVLVLPLAPRLAREAKLVIVQARKGAHGRFRLLPPFVLHTGTNHLQDGDDYTPETSAILRQGAALDLSALTTG